MSKSFEGDTKAVLIAFIGVIIAIVLLASVANQVFNTTNTFTITKTTVTSPADGVQLNLVGRELVGSVVCANDSGADCAGNFTFEDVISNGIKTIQMNTTVAGIANGYDEIVVNLTYTYNPDGYLSAGSDRSIMNLIIIFGAIAAMVFVLVEFAREGTLGKLLRGK